MTKNQYARTRNSSGIDGCDRLWTVLRESNGRWIAYVYRVDRQGRVARPYLTKYEAWPDLLKTLRNEFGGGVFEVLI